MTPLEKAVGDIKSMRVQGAKEIAIYGLTFLRDFAKKNGFKLKFETAAHFLEEARPTAVVLHNCVEIVKRRRKISTIDKLIRDLGRSSEKIGKYSDRVIKKNWKVMTHCHSGEALAFIKHAWLRHKKKISVIATETEPLEQGVKTAKELAAVGIPVTLITDSTVGFFAKEIDAVIVGADAIRVVPPYGVVNKIGTFNLALAARRYKKPFYVIGNSLKVDRRKNFKIEERPSKEVYKKLKGVKIRNPAFDIIGFDLVTKIVTEKGIYSPGKFRRIFG